MNASLHRSSEARRIPGALPVGCIRASCLLRVRGGAVCARQAVAARAAAEGVVKAYAPPLPFGGFQSRSADIAVLREVKGFGLLQQARLSTDSSVLRSVSAVDPLDPWPYSLTTCDDDERPHYKLNSIQLQNLF